MPRCEGLPELGGNPHFRGGPCPYLRNGDNVFADNSAELWLCRDCEYDHMASSCVMNGNPVPPPPATRGLNLKYSATQAEPDAADEDNNEPQNDSMYGRETNHDITPTVSDDTTNESIRSDGSLVIINELLCYSMSMMQYLPEAAIIKTCADHYDIPSIEAAKNLVFSHNENSNLRKSNRIGSGKETRNMQDIMAVLRGNDPMKLPTFVALDIGNLPAIGKDCVNLAMVLTQMNQLRGDVDNLKSIQSSITTLLSAVNEIKRENEVRSQTSQEVMKQLQQLDNNQCNMSSSNHTSGNGYDDARLSSPHLVSTPSNRVTSPLINRPHSTPSVIRTDILSDAIVSDINSDDGDNQTDKNHGANHTDNNQAVNYTNKTHGANHTDKNHGVNQYHGANHTDKNHGINQYHGANQTDINQGVNHMVKNLGANHTDINHGVNHTSHMGKNRGTNHTDINTGAINLVINSDVNNLDNNSGANELVNIPVTNSPINLVVKSSTHRFHGESTTPVNRLHPTNNDHNIIDDPRNILHNLQTQTLMEDKPLLSDLVKRLDQDDRNWTTVGRLQRRSPHREDRAEGSTFTAAKRRHKQTVIFLSNCGLHTTSDMVVEVVLAKFGIKLSRCEQVKSKSKNPSWTSFKLFADLACEKQLLDKNKWYPHEDLVVRLWERKQRSPQQQQHDNPYIPISPESVHEDYLHHRDIGYFRRYEQRYEPFADY